MRDNQEESLSLSQAVNFDNTLYVDETYSSFSFF